MLISVFSFVISIVSGRIKSISVSDFRKVINIIVINEYTVDWVIKCFSNVCIMCLLNGRSRDFVNFMLFR